MTSLRSVWQIRRVIWNKYVVFFTKLDEDVVFDSIPLAEITSVQMMEEFAKSNVDDSNFELHLKRTGLFIEIFLRTTWPHVIQLIVAQFLIVIRLTAPGSVGSFSQSSMHDSRYFILASASHTGLRNALQIKTLADGYNSGDVARPHIS